MSPGGRATNEALALVLIDPRDPRYAGELDLRHRVLRQPLGFRRDQVASPFEEESLHLCALDEGERVVGCVLFRWLDARRGRLFQMAVDPGWQRRGLGRRLLDRLEAELRARGVAEVVLHAREPAVPFYARAGYAAEGDVFMEVGIAHRTMRKALAA